MQKTWTELSSSLCIFFIHTQCEQILVQFVHWFTRFFFSCQLLLRQTSSSFLSNCWFLGISFIQKLKTYLKTKTSSMKTWPTSVVKILDLRGLKIKYFRHCKHVVLCSYIFNCQNLVRQKLSMARLSHFEN